MSSSSFVEFLEMAFDFGGELTISMLVNTNMLSFGFISFVVGSFGWLFISITISGFVTAEDDDFAGSLIGTTTGFAGGMEIVPFFVSANVANVILLLAFCDAAYSPSDNSVTFLCKIAQFSTHLLTVAWRSENFFDKSDGRELTLLCTSVTWFLVGFNAISI